MAKGLPAKRTSVKTSTVTKDSLILMLTKRPGLNSKTATANGRFQILSVIQ